VKRARILAPCLLIAVTAVTGHATTIFNISGTTGDPLADAAFDQAASQWSAILLDDVTINITRASASLASGALAQTSNNFTNYTYTQLRNALIDDATSADDATVVANLDPGSSLGMLINRTSNSPNGSGSATPYVDNDGDANNSTVHIANANAKALGLLGPSAAVDGSITFNDAGGFVWDFDPSDGITAGAYDFVGIVAHEIGHFLGFFSGVDILDANSPPNGGPFPDNAFTFMSVLDIFRHSALSEASNVIDWTADSRSKYFSIDGGTTPITTFSTGRTFGDGRQASHWQDFLGIGIMDPTAGKGELLQLTNNDLLAFDAIGWNLTSVPEPSSIALGFVGLAAILVAKLERSSATSR